MNKEQKKIIIWFHKSGYNYDKYQIAILNE